MRRLHVIIVNALLFYFIVAVVNGVHIYNSHLISTIIAALIFGFLMSSVVFVLRFFKITVNAPSKLLLSVVFAFAFFFLIYSGALGLGSITGSVIDLGIAATSALTLDAIGTLIFVSLVSGLGSAALDWLSKA